MRELSLAGFAAMLIAVAGTVPVSAADFNEVWRTGGFEAPESVAYDAASNSLFVSNMNGADFVAKDGNGYISRLDAGGDVVARKWIEGLHSPKGLDIADGHLFVADVEQLVEIDIATATVVNRFDVAGALLFNDVAASPDGSVFVSETLSNAIYRLRDGKFDLFVQDPALEGPNGLFVEGDRLIVASVGDLSGGFDNRQPSNVKIVDLTTKQITDFGPSEPIGGLDGLEPAGDGTYLVTDFFDGKLLSVSPNGDVMELMELGPGSADLEFVPAMALVVVPIMNEGAVVGFEGGK